MEVLGVKIKIEWLVIIGLIIYIVFLQQCSSSTTTGNTLVSTDTVYSTSIDTLYEVKVDTIRFHTTDTIRVAPEITPPIINEDSTKEYTLDISDTLIQGSIVSLVNGELLGQSLMYVPLFPKYITKDSIVYIHQKDSVKITNNLEVKKFRVSVGGELGGSPNSFSLGPVIMFHTKKNFNYGYRYGVLDKSHNIVITKTLTFKKPKIFGK